MSRSGSKRRKIQKPDVARVGENQTLDLRQSAPLKWVVADATRLFATPTHPIGTAQPVPGNRTVGLRRFESLGRR